MRGLHGDFPMQGTVALWIKQKETVSSGTIKKRNLFQNVYRKMTPHHHTHSLFFICAWKKVTEKAICPTHWGNKQFRKLNSNPKECQSLWCTLEWDDQIVIFKWSGVRLKNKLWLFLDFWKQMNVQKKKKAVLYVSPSYFKQILASS